MARQNDSRCHAGTERHLLNAETIAHLVDQKPAVERDCLDTGVDECHVFVAFVWSHRVDQCCNDLDRTAHEAWVSRRTCRSEVGGINRSLPVEVACRLALKHENSAVPAAFGINVRLADGNQRSQQPVK